MAIVTTKLHVEIDPKSPVNEALAVVDVLIKYNGPQYIESILKGVYEGVENRLNEVKKKGVDNCGEPVSGPGRSGANPQ